MKWLEESIQQIPSGPGGGHRCWKVQSNKSRFFIKQLDPTWGTKNISAAMNGAYGNIIFWMLRHISLIDTHSEVSLMEIRNSIEAGSKLLQSHSAIFH